MSLSAPTKQDTIPILAWKLCNLTRDGEGYRFYRIGALSLFKNFRGSYGIEGTAECVSPRYRRSGIPKEFCTKDVPNLSCVCGFYAVREIELLKENYCGSDTRDLTEGQVLLQVELYGKVIVHSRGYRAEKQRVLEMWLPTKNDPYPANGIRYYEAEEVEKMRQFFGIPVNKGWDLDGKFLQ